MDYKQMAAQFSLLSQNQTSKTDVGLDLLVGAAAVLLLLCIVFGLVRFVTDFSTELWYLNMEIARTEGEERRYYIRQRRRLWLSLLLFVRYR